MDDEDSFEQHVDLWREKKYVIFSLFYASDCMKKKKKIIGNPTSNLLETCLEDDDITIVRYDWTTTASTRYRNLYDIVR